MVFYISISPKKQWKRELSQPTVALEFPDQMLLQMFWGQENFYHLPIEHPKFSAWQAWIDLLSETVYCQIVFS